MQQKQVLKVISKDERYEKVHNVFARLPHYATR